MVDRVSCERRVYRLATLLTGNPRAATEVMARVLDAQPDLRRMDSGRMDRLTVLRSREVPTGTLVADGVPAPLAERLATMSSQQRETWVLARLYRLPEREMARAMDCSVTAARRHLQAADAAAGSEGAEAVAALLGYTQRLDVPQFYRAIQVRRRRRRRLVWVGLSILLAAAVLGMCQRWLEGMAG